eukprot:Colp12_sorted_trinity150504_noHs@72
MKSRLDSAAFTLFNTFCTWPYNSFWIRQGNKFSLWAFNMFSLRMMDLFKSSDFAGARTWFQLNDPFGQPYKGVTADFVKLPPGSDIAQLRDAVKVKNGNKLSSVDAVDLQIYPSKAAFERRDKEEPLQPYQLVDDIGKSAQEAVVVVVPTFLEDLSKETKTHIQTLKQATFFTWSDGAMACVTAYDKHHLATFAHGVHNALKVGDTVWMYPIVNHDKRYNVKVVKVDKEHDFILLESDNEVCAFKIQCAGPYEGEPYFQLGLSATAQQKSPFSIAQGVFSTTEFDRHGHILGSAGSNAGESGGGCFATNSRRLYGINVGCEAVTILGSTTLDELGTRYPARAHIVPSSFFN